MSFVSIPFYYRTNEDYAAVKEYVGKLNTIAITTYGLSNIPLFSPDYVNVRSYAQTIEGIHKKIPMRRRGKKKYIGTLGIKNSLYGKFTKDRNIEKDLAAIDGIVLIAKEGNQPKLREEDLTREDVRLKSVKHFKKLISLMNKEYGDGNWHLRGAKKIIAKLSNAENIKQFPHFAHKRTKETDEINEKGLKIQVVVKRKVDNLKPLLFKLQLMT